MSKRIKNNLVLVLLLLGVAKQYSIAQQEYIFSNTSINPGQLNPAANGLCDLMQLEFGARTQWSGYEGAPQTLKASFHTLVGSKNEKAVKEFNGDGAFFAMPDNEIGKTKHVLGGTVNTDLIGPFAKSGLYFNYALHLRLTKKMNFGAGLGLGWSNFRIKEQGVRLYQEDDALYTQFLSSTSQMNSIDANAGLVFYTKRLIFGISSSQLLNNHIVFDQTKTNSYYERHYLLTTSYRFDAGSILEVEPLLAMRYTSSSPVSIDAGLRLIYKKSLWAGVQYRYQNALLLMLGSTLVKNIYINYAYEHSIGEISLARNGTHEVHLGMWIGRKRNTEKEIEKSKEEGSKIQ